ncbi:cation:proton antiporter [Lacticaseibacillus zeae]|uniref:Sodium:proton antiporter n=1 Tax=Lacticaseibacillus zeae subsp. silagei TaxID=3068307 RepID=A0ABD7ZB30_LACZE|nr:MULTISPECIES: sodium:proton antiporter [Lacticaseibacillus]MDE3314549.1 sodium:proton antiporter [Lacticaseibacillus zeae]OFR92343.1 sodium:proton antiporter [Lactobacillus sp. HMSC068F07]WLV84173.1 sodium:proton antiporter [Lacticaseibacillus sp. NCIMB 15475]
MSQVVIFGIMLATVIVGNLLARHIPKIPLPFFLIGLGAALAIMPSLRNFAIDPSVFSFAIIAPLLFNEGQNASRLQIGRSLTNIVSLAVGLVLFSVIILGFSVHALFPVIPLSLAFALIAIVTPTDASAVSAVAQTNPLSDSQMQLLNNESLFNDAAGIVAFDLALSAYVSGRFSATDALLDFLFVFFGGILVGAIIGTLIVNLRAWLIRIGDDEPLIMVGIQLLTPLLVYFLAEELALSGILAVVAAGIAQGVERDRLRLTSARMQIISANVWEMIAAVLSGLVFVLLGLSLPNVVIEALRGQAGLFSLLVGIGVFIYAAKSLVRFFWSRTLLRIGKKNRWRNALIMMLGGANGTITLSLAFSMPRTINGHEFALRQGLILIAAVVILLSLIVPVIVLPFCVPKQPKRNRQYIWLRRMLSAGIDAMRDETEHHSEAQIVADALSQEMILNDNPSRRLQRSIFEGTITAEKAAIEALRANGTITKDEAYYYNRFIDLNDFTADQRLWKNLFLRIRFSINMGRMYKAFNEAQNAFLTTPLNLEPIFWKRQFTAHGEDLLPIEQAGYDAVMKYLTHIENVQNRSAVNTIRRFYRDRHRRVHSDSFDGDILYAMFLKAFHAEYEFIQQAFADGKLNRDIMQRLQTRITFDEITYLKNQDSFIV